MWLHVAADIRMFFMVEWRRQPFWATYSRRWVGGVGSLYLPLL